jgi:hypothetical protein
MMNYIEFFRNNLEKIEENSRLYVSRKIAKKKIDEINRLKGFKVVDSNILKEIKSYSKERFGSSLYWPWLVLYTEIRGEFYTGWIPDDYYRVILRKKYNPAKARFFGEYKSLDYKLFDNFSFKYLIYCISQKFYKGDGTPVKFREAQSILNNFDGEVVIKPELGWKGLDIEFSHSKSIDILKLSNKNDFLIQPLFIQCSELNRVNSNSLNTLRLFTYSEPGTEPQLKFTVLRFSIDESRVDNISSGGGFVRVLENGKLDEFYYDEFGIKRDKIHPLTGIKFNEITIPNFEEVISKCKMAHQKFPYVRFIGWDVAIGKDRESKLIEWNADDPALWKYEALFGPFFYKDHIM